jgi:hypothetical protein
MIEKAVAGFVMIDSFELRMLRQVLRVRAVD